jgi:hypothetical protein
VDLGPVRRLREWASGRDLIMPGEDLEGHPEWVVGKWDGDVVAICDWVLGLKKGPSDP